MKNKLHLSVLGLLLAVLFSCTVQENRPKKTTKVHTYRVFYEDHPDSIFYGDIYKPDWVNLSLAPDGRVFWDTYLHSEYAVGLMWLSTDSLESVKEGSDIHQALLNIITYEK